MTYYNTKANLTLKVGQRYTTKRGLVATVSGNSSPGHYEVSYNDGEYCYVKEDGSINGAGSKRYHLKNLIEDEDNGPIPIGERDSVRSVFSIKGDLRKAYSRDLELYRGACKDNTIISFGSMGSIVVLDSQVDELIAVLKHLKDKK